MIFPRQLGTDYRKESLMIAILGTVLGSMSKCAIFFPLWSFMYSRNKVWCQQGPVVFKMAEGPYVLEQAHAVEIWHSGCFLYTGCVIGSAPSNHDTFRKA